MNRGKGEMKRKEKGKGEIIRKAGENIQREGGMEERRKEKKE